MHASIHAYNACICTPIVFHGNILLCQRPQPFLSNAPSPRPARLATKLRPAIQRFDATVADVRINVLREAHESSWHRICRRHCPCHCNKQVTGNRRKPTFMWTDKKIRRRNSLIHSSELTNESTWIHNAKVRDSGPLIWLHSGAWYEALLRETDMNLSCKHSCYQRDNHQQEPSHTIIAVFVINYHQLIKHLQNPFLSINNSNYGIVAITH